VIGLTPRQADVLRFIAGYREAHGCAPAFREIADGLNAPIGSAISDRLVALEERGHIRRKRYRERSIEVLGSVALPRAPDGSPLYAVPGFGEH
jgi:SOS-response transcriptional repressor LexA